MFGTLKKVVENTKALTVNNVAVNIWQDNQVRKFIIDLNAFDQLFQKGEDKKGKLLGVYTEFTEIAHELKAYSFDGETHTKVAGEHYDFFDKGEFLPSFNVVIQPGGFTINADDEKADGTQLTRKFGNAILGLSNESINKLAKEILPTLQQLVREKILA